MKICILQLANGHSSSVLFHTDSKPVQTESFKCKHEFATRFTEASTSEQQIDAVAAENFDFYFNLLQSSSHNPSAAKKASEYFEKLNLPSCATTTRSSSKTRMTSTMLPDSGSPPVPGEKRYPLSVKSSKGGLSRAIGGHSICRDENELKSAIERINKALDDPLGASGQSRRNEALANSVVPCCVQEYVADIDMTCTVIVMGGRCIALNPVVYNTNETTLQESFVTFEIRSNPATTAELLPKNKDQDLYQRIQKAAIDASIVSGCRPSTMDGSIFVVSVNTQPPATHIPGGLSSLHDTFIANHLLRTNQSIEKNDKLAETYAIGADSYEKLLSTSEVPKLVKQIVEQRDFTGTVFDIACGTSTFGQLLTQMKPELAQKKSRKLFAFDIAPGMLKLCDKSGVYEATHNDTMEETLLNFRRYAEQVDHIVCLTALQFLRPEVFPKSITFTVNHAPDSYNDWLSERGYPHMHATDHSMTVDAFGEPEGWKLVWKRRELAIKPPMTGDNIYQMVYHFERVKGSSQDIMLGDQVTI
ncbi:2-C-methyl-D-erythritol 2,4-cyclodiphosphate synthase [Xylariaceae sp. FL1272]|nr:2-C-methyl-D-erythritol 2,4-cyclodiphosphate synthase [Xylariaceae sp. FL1272]